ncbi:sensor histidine kinase [Virgibacillus litoralis]|uniref:histidine kinase n=1 Tax=Virgibacillus litoralis TaxID=578221 RepID=A0ABS4HB96_9BACI|nr:ATP-binding protein [Virgibacillus litoralis]MBP1948185.1 two-component system sensor histidine kinase BaeS [Virgibacillus litoralis]
MSIRKRIISKLPKGFLWRLSALNFLVVASAIVVSGLATYNTACFLVDAMGGLEEQRQQQFNATLFNYLWIFIITAIVTGSLLHFYMTKKLIRPIRSLIESTKQLKKGNYPDPVEVTSQDEVGELAVQFNALIQQLHTNEQHRQKLVSDLSHEFRTPLTNLNGYLQSLERGDIQGNQDLYKALYQESQRLTVMIEQLEQLKEWDYVTSQTYSHSREVDIANLINQCVAMFQLQMEEKDIGLSVNVSSCKLHIHEEGIQQIISNLLENAIQYYNGEGGIHVLGEQQNSVYRIVVSGPSAFIPESERENIFERFYRLDTSRSRKTGGSGLGLAIAKEIIDRHGGQIGVISEKNTNTFWFTLPLA